MMILRVIFRQDGLLGNLDLNFSCIASRHSLIFDDPSHVEPLCLNQAFSSIAIDMDTRAQRCGRFGMRRFPGSGLMVWLWQLQAVCKQEARRAGSWSWVVVVAGS